MLHYIVYNDPFQRDSMDSNRQKCLKDRTVSSIKIAQIRCFYSVFKGVLWDHDFDTLCWGPSQLSYDPFKFFWRVGSIKAVTNWMNCGLIIKM